MKFTGGFILGFAVFAVSASYMPDEAAHTYLGTWAERNTVHALADISRSLTRIAGALDRIERKSSGVK